MYDLEPRGFECSDGGVVSAGEVGGPHAPVAGVKADGNARAEEEIRFNFIRARRLCCTRSKVSGAMRRLTPRPIRVAPRMGFADVAVRAVHLAVVDDESDAWSADEERSIGSARSEPASWVWRSPLLVRPSSRF